LSTTWIDAGDRNALQPRTAALDDCDVAFGGAESLGEQLDQFLIGRVFDGRRLQPDEQCAITDSGDAAPARAWDNPDGELDHDRPRLADAACRIGKRCDLRTMLDNPVFALAAFLLADELEGVVQR